MSYKLKPEASGSILLGCLAAFAVELIWTMLSCLAVAILIEKGMTGDESLALWSAGIILLGSMLGAFSAMYFVKEWSWFIFAIYAGLYFVQLLVLNMMFFRVGLNGVPVTFLLIAGGTTAAALLNTCKNGSVSGFNRKAKLDNLYKIYN